MSTYRPGGHLSTSALSFSTLSQRKVRQIAFVTVALLRHDYHHNSISNIVSFAEMIELMFGKGNSGEKTRFVLDVGRRDEMR